MYNKIKLYGLFTVFIFILFYTTLINAATIYLDANLSANCTSGNYSIVNRACAGSDGNSFNNLGDAISNLAGGDTLYIRSGTYIRTTHDLSTGSLSISASGTLGQHTVVSNYSGEQPVIFTEAGRCLYNPNPNDTSTPVCNGNSQGGSACYYPNPAISIGGSYIDLIGIKTYGQAYISAAHDV